MSNCVKNCKPHSFYRKFRIFLNTKLQLWIRGNSPSCGETDAFRGTIIAKPNIIADYWLCPIILTKWICIIGKNKVILRQYVVLPKTSTQFEGETCCNVSKLLQLSHNVIVAYFEYFRICVMFIKRFRTRLF